MFAKKTCTQCEKRLSTAMFHSDKSSKDGKSSSCKACRNSRRRGSDLKAKGIKTLWDKALAEASMPLVAASVMSPVKVPITSDDDISLLEQVREKYSCHYSLSINRNGCARLQVHSFPANLSFKAETPKEALQAALAY